MRKNIIKTIFILVLAIKKRFVKERILLNLFFNQKAYQNYFKYIEGKVINFLSFNISFLYFNA